MVHGPDKWLLTDDAFDFNWKFLRSMVAAFTPRFTPVSSETMRDSMAGKVTLFRTFNVGVAGRGTSSMLPNYSAYKADEGLVWYMR